MTKNTTAPLVKTLKRPAVKPDSIIRIIIYIVGAAGRQSLDLGRDFGASLFGKFHNQRQVFAGAARRGFIGLLSESHILGGESSDLNQKFAGGAALGAAVEESLIQYPALRHPRGGPHINFAPLFH
jgi:hypothetical protein